MSISSLNIWKLDFKIRHSKLSLLESLKLNQYLWPIVCSCEKFTRKFENMTRFYGIYNTQFKAICTYGQELQYL